MTVQQFWKGLAMLIVSLVLSALGQIPADYALLFVGGVSTLLGYVGKNLLFVTATTTITKIISGILVAIATAIPESIGLIVVEHKIVWVVLLKVVGGVLGTYLIATFLTPSTTQPKLVKKFNLSK
jgi:hypothetical protein